MTLKELLSGIKIGESNAPDMLDVTGLFYDSRSVKPGGAFVAIEGYETDGHKYIPAAVENGAAVVICRKKPELSVPYVLVENTRRALALAAANLFGNPADKMKIIGVTGTNGKTTVTTLIKSVIEHLTGEKVGLIGTNQNMIGDIILNAERTTPESYELQKLFADMAEAGCTYVVMEVSSHSLVLERVAGIIFEAAVFTNLTQDHLDFHKTMEEYKRAKALLFKQAKKGIINLDDKAAEYIIEQSECPVLTYASEKNEADLVAKDIKLKENKVEFCLIAEGTIKRTELNIPGRFSVYNALAAIGCCMQLGISAGDAVGALAECGGVKGRVEVVPTGKDYTILIDYAHTPDALENVLSTVRGFAKGRVILVFGCGGDRDKTKRPKMGAIAAAMADVAVVTSDNPRTEEPESIIADIVEGMKGTKSQYIVITNRREAIRRAMDIAKTGDVIILAGKGHETYQIIGQTKHHMDEREIVAEILAEEK